MSTTKSIARQLLSAALLAALAAPAFAQGLNPHHTIKKTLKDAKAAADVAAAAAAVNVQEAEKKAAAAEKLAADTRAGKIPPPKGIGDKFNPVTVKPYVDNLSSIMGDLKATTNAAQANAYAPKFKTVLGMVEANHDKALKAYTDAITSGVKTADNDAAEKLLTNAAGMAEAIEKDMLRVQQLNPALAADFKKFSDLHDQE